MLDFGEFDFGSKQAVGECEHREYREHALGDVPKRTPDGRCCIGEIEIVYGVLTGWFHAASPFALVIDQHSAFAADDVCGRLRENILPARSGKQNTPDVISRR
jgi:hypothetical protein